MTEASFVPSVSPDIWALRPDFKALSITARGMKLTADTTWATERLAEACKSTANMKPWGQAHLASWQEAYRGFGAKPQRTPCSVEALLKRVTRDGALPSAGPLVDFYNAISIAYVLPVGGEDMGMYQGSPRLVRATAGDLFETTKDAQIFHEPVDAGEVVWRDDVGVTCRRWNWRQTPRTRVTPETVEAWFVFESLGAMPLDALQAAGDDFVAGLRQHAGNPSITTALIERL
jgi:DNA/RNA-binding domain of Phe-tRNA-synthetase-like protein